MTTPQPDLWAYRHDTGRDRIENLVGWTVEGVDGRIGKVHEAVDLAGAARLVVGTGPWIFGKEVVVPAGAVTSIDADRRVLRLDRRRRDVKGAPSYDPGRDGDFESYRSRLGEYYVSPNSANRLTP